MKKILIVSLFSIAFLFSSIAFAENQKDQKSLNSAIKKSIEMKSQLKLTSDQQKRVQGIFYTSFSEIRSTHDNEGMTKTEKISKYNEINTRTQAELQNVLTPEQYQKYLSPGSGQ